IDMSEKNLSPLHALLGAFGSCVGVFVRKYADNLKLPIKEFSVCVESDLVKENPMGFRYISVSIDLKGVELDDTKREGLMRFIGNCPVGNTLRGNPEINVVLK
ncbi:MAG: OsmC family protein, partial [Candidatus Omnitrophica bacterium]|nr:OsmC family protein [Candidatus Omnitrophota bacterium]